MNPKKAKILEYLGCGFWLCFLLTMSCALLWAATWFITEIIMMVTAL